MSSALHDGRLTIGYPSGGRIERAVRISLVDESSRAVVFEVHMERADFMEALTSRADQPCQFAVIGVAHVGQSWETKTEWVQVPDNIHHVRDVDESDTDDARRLQAVVAGFCVDGWTARLSDLQNHHRWPTPKESQSLDKPKKDHHWVRVLFHRYVAKEKAA